jgi:hypothetical protein
MAEKLLTLSQVFQPENERSNVFTQLRMTVLNTNGVAGYCHMTMTREPLDAQGPVLGPRVVKGGGPVVFSDRTYGVPFTPEPGQPDLDENHIQRFSCREVDQLFISISNGFPIASPGYSARVRFNSPFDPGIKVDLAPQGEFLIGTTPKTRGGQTTYSFAFFVDTTVIR